MFGKAPVEEGVSRDLARDRARIVSNIRYGLNLELRPRAARMPGHVVIGFDLASLRDPLILDFRADEASARDLNVNGVPEALQQSGGHILISGKNLKRGTNRVELDFESGIAEANSAVTRFIDSQDGSEYLYTLFVPMDASLAFPCFDQPDLKARFTLSVTAPTGWKVISNTNTNQVASAGAVGTFSFEETKPISTYLFAFAAGPFEQLDSPPFRLFVRKSMLARAKEEWPAVAETTRKGMALMTQFFAQPFPFPKYDEVLIPGFPYGGMEHAGATFLQRRQRPVPHRRPRSTTTIAATTPCCMNWRTNGSAIW